MAAKNKTIQGQVSPIAYAKFKEFESARGSSMAKALNAVLEGYFGIAQSDSQVNHNELLATESESLEEKYRALTEQIATLSQDVESLKNNESQRELQSESNQLSQLPTRTIVAPPASSDLRVNQDDSLTSSQEYPSVDESNLPMTVEDALETSSSNTKDESPIQETLDAIESSNTSVEIDSQVAVTILDRLAKHIVKELKRCKTKDELASLGSRYTSEVKEFAWRYLTEEERARIWTISNKNPSKTANSDRLSVEQMAGLFLISPTRVNQVAREGHKTFREWSSWFRKGTWDFVEIETSNKINRKRRLFYKVN